MDLTLKEKLANVGNYTKGRTRKIEYIVEHYTANDGDTDEGNGKYFANNKVGASANWFVDEDSATRSVNESDTAHHCGLSKDDDGNYIFQGSSGHTFAGKCTNSNSIGIEMCSDKVKGKFILTEKTIANAVDLTRYLMNKYSVPIEKVIRHYDVTGKICPKPFVEDESKWLDFKKRLLATDPKREAAAMELANKIAKDVVITDVSGLALDLAYYYKGSCWYVIEKLAALKAKSAPIDGKKDIYRRVTTSGIIVTEKTAFNSELLNIGQDSIFWVIKKYLDKLGVA